MICLLLTGRQKVQYILQLILYLLLSPVAFWGLFCHSAAAGGGGGFTHQTPFENSHFLVTRSASLFLSVQAMKLSTLQPVWRGWSECFGGWSGHFGEVFVLWRRTTAEGYSSTCLIPNNQQRPQCDGGHEARQSPWYSPFLRQRKTHISYFHHICSFIFKRIKSTSFIFIWNTLKFLHKEDSCFFFFFNKGSVCFEKQHLPAGTGRVELLGPFFFIFLAIFYIFLLF